MFYIELESFVIRDESKGGFSIHTQLPHLCGGHLAFSDQEKEMPNLSNDNIWFGCQALLLGTSSCSRWKGK